MSKYDTGERDDLRASDHELRHHLIPMVLACLRHPKEYPPSSRHWGWALEGCSTFLETTIATAEERAGTAEYPITGKSEREASVTSAGPSTAWRNSRADGEPITSAPRDTCARCGEDYYLLSCPQKSGMHFTIKVDAAGFRHRCEMLK